MECGAADLGGCRHGDEALMSLGRFAPNTRETAPETKARVWREYGLLVVDVDKDQLSWDQREMLRVIGRKMFGPRREEKR